MIDTPLHGFDEGENGLEKSIRAGLFDYLAEQAKEQQIIILENTDRTRDLNLQGNDAHVIAFSKSKEHGRYGYLEGVYDIAEENPA